MFLIEFLVTLGLSLAVFGAAFIDNEPDSEETDTAGGSGTGDSGTSGSGTPAVPGGDINAFLVMDGDSYEGTEGADLYVPDPEAEGFSKVDIEAGNGDDILYLHRSGAEIFLSGASIDTGPGRDTVELTAEASTVDLGLGDDRLAGLFLGGTIDAGAGNDHVDIVAGPSDTVVVKGGEGDDTLDGRGSQNLVLSGGAGNDLLSSDGFVREGTGYVLRIKGDDGDDILHHDFRVFPPNVDDPGPEDIEPVSMAGGAGADLFEVALTYGEGSFADTPDLPPASLPIAEIEDFEPGNDRLVVDLVDAALFYEATEAEMTEDPEAGTTTLRVFLQGQDQLPSRVAEIVIHATGLGWDDVAFVGQAPALSQAA